MPTGHIGPKSLFSPLRSQVSTTLWPVVSSATTGHDGQREKKFNERFQRRNIMNIQNKTILITGANRGIGRALVEEALKRGAKRVYAATRQPFTHFDGRVTP